uniref:Uncharacterized protein n=1 Tax=Rhizophora mucronata TaxID=61149 RepID=A0A2P2NE23_RHIMU
MCLVFLKFLDLEIMFTAVLGSQALSSKLLVFNKQTIPIMVLQGKPSS